MNGRFAFGAPAGFGGANIALGILGLVFTALLIAATIILIIMLIDAARARGVEVKGGRLAGFWIVGLVLTPIPLALYVLCIKPTEAHVTVEAPATDGPASPFGNGTRQPVTGTSVFEVPAGEAVTVDVEPVAPTTIVEDGPTTVIDGASA